ncbi:stage V sporulation protein K [Bacillus sp. FJAT-42315]|uniref:stage V sporulation protein K n=1 Tax=Bacillus sp. FJAT-42315 TaxID=2014077 RepID=UPI000C24D7D2|nr:stage V sporulation protein K [Bacillus sp. FJAT-42315]
MKQPIRMKESGQIKVVLHTKNDRIEQQPTRQEKPFEWSNSNEHAVLKSIENELDALIGLDELKKMIREIYAWIYINRKREASGLKSGSQVLHMMFKGNPGTGKTTVARIIGRLFFEMKVLSKGHLIEAERADLVGEYIGHTAQKTRDLIKKAMGGILFIDEAYSLGRGGEKDFGKEAIDTLVKHMEDKQNDFILILAGYPKEMDHFFTLNPGLESRFPFVFQFPDYEPDQLMEIAEKITAEKQYQLSPEAKIKMREHFMFIKEKNPSSFSNGRYVRNLIEKAMRSHAVRLLKESNYHYQDLMLIRSCDISY